MARYKHLTLEERRTVYHMVQARRPVREVAALLGRHPSTIYRELDRNWHHDEHPPFRGYFHTVAQEKARKRRIRGGKIARCGELGGYIADRLAAAWSPEQISGHLRRRPVGPSVCHETIYQYVYGAHGRRQDLWRLLPCARRSRRARYGRKPRGFRIPVENTIAARPPEVAERGSFGHWEGDLIAFRQVHGKANLTSLVERRSRYAVLLRNPSRHSTGVMAGIDRRLRALPESLRRSLTLDRGTEFAGYGRLKQGLGMTTYFCQPSSPWQKGSVENSNGRVRRFLPLDTDLAGISDEELTLIVERLNNTPRKCLGYRTPEEVWSEQVGLAEAA